MMLPATGGGGFGGCSGLAHVIPGGLPSTHLLTASVWAALHPRPLFLCLEETPSLKPSAPKVKLSGTEQLNSQRHLLESQSREGWGCHTASAPTGSQAPWVQLHPSRAGYVSLSKPCPSRGLLGTQGSRDSARQVQGTEPRPCLPRPWAGGGRRSAQPAPGREAAGGAGEVSGGGSGGPGEADSACRSRAALGSAFLTGANLPSEVATTGRTGSMNPGTAPPSALARPRPPTLAWPPPWGTRPRLA